ncbi:MAG: hypothetical protein ACKOED_03435 [Aestuariivirga sp.]|jgi:hypothetical protein|uniref:hypothetical protein n=1 Tax=Aestuariivirga sp. TaxID=2650926 RepID=UPI0038D14BBE
MLSKIRLELARDHDHPKGTGDIGYEFAAPLDGHGKIIPEEWHKHRDHCRVVRFRPNEDDDIGHLVRKPGGSWAFHYDIASDAEDDEQGYRFDDHAFKVGEYVSIREDDGLRTFRVVRVQPVA